MVSGVEPYDDNSTLCPSTMLRMTQVLCNKIKIFEKKN